MMREFVPLHVFAAETVQLALWRVIDAAHSSSEGDPLPDTIAACDRAARFVGALIQTGDAVALTQWAAVLQGAIEMMEDGRATVALSVSSDWIRWIDYDILRAHEAVAEFLATDDGVAYSWI